MKVPKPGLRKTELGIWGRVSKRRVQMGAGGRRDNRGPGDREA